MRMFNKLAFTLAEVLITLGIIGVVAALTVPTLINNANNAVAITGAKEATSILNNAIKMYMIDNNCNGNLKLCDAFSSDQQYVWDSFKPYFKIQQDCCLSGTCIQNGSRNKLDGITTYGNVFGWAYGKGVLANGMIIEIYGYNPAYNCNWDGLIKSNGCGKIFIDINGNKPPNAMGRDTFSWYITTEGIYPTGYREDMQTTNADGTPACNINGSTAAQKSGEGCTAKILQENAVNY